MESLILRLSNSVDITQLMTRLGEMTSCWSEEEIRLALEESFSLLLPVKPHSAISLGRIFNIQPHESYMEKVVEDLLEEGRINDAVTVSERWSPSGSSSLLRHACQGNKMDLFRRVVMYDNLESAIRAIPDNRFLSRDHCMVLLELNPELLQKFPRRCYHRAIHIDGDLDGWLPILRTLPPLLPSPPLMESIEYWVQVDSVETFRKLAAEGILFQDLVGAKAALSTMSQVRDDGSRLTIMQIVWLAISLLRGGDMKSALGWLVEVVLCTPPRERFWIDILSVLLHQLLRYPEMRGEAEKWILVIQS